MKHTHPAKTDLSRLLASRRWAEKLSLSNHFITKATLLGQRRSRFRGRGMEFEEVRRYQPGDDIRTIDWRVTARAPGTYTKLFSEERERPCHLIVDQRSRMFFGSKSKFKAVFAIEIMAALGWASLASGDRVSAQILTDSEIVQVPAGRNKNTVLRLIRSGHEHNHLLYKRLTDAATADLKHEYQGETQPSMRQCLEQSLRQLSSGTAIFVISDFSDLDPGYRTLIRQLARFNDLSAIQTLDTLELNLPMVEAANLTNGRSRLRVSINRRVQSDYAQAQQQRLDEVRQMLVNVGGQYLFADTQLSTRKLLSNWFTR